MSRRVTRSAFTLIEVLIATVIAGILAGLAIPTALEARRNAVASQALADLRLIDMAISSSCSRGRCGPFNPPGSFGGTVSIVPAALQEFLPTGYKFAIDTSVYAVEMEAFEFFGTGAPLVAPPVCVPACVVVPPQIATGPDSTGFVNTAGFSSPPTIYVAVNILTRDQQMAQRMYDRAGGTMPVYMPSHHVWRYTFPVLVGVSAVD